MTLELTTVKSLRETVAAWRAGGELVALVPTMGALHAGHLELVKVAQMKAKRVIVSIFVNPTQFGPNEDFKSYPRTLERDLRLLCEAGVDAAWLPTLKEMYPQGFSTSVKAGSAGAGLDGDSRPGHFDGVATVVTKLLVQAMPDVALFGQKDYQQLCVIRQLVRDLNIPVFIVGVPTVREVDGLALSSRNQYLTVAEREVAPKLYDILKTLASKLVIPAQAGMTDEARVRDEGDSRLRGNDGLLKKAVDEILKAGFVKVDYLELRAEDTLAPLQSYVKPSRLLVAAWLGKTRLIDNITVE
ncbi:MAG: pantoate--beta-alanine ligase [Rickettsiales bacterium]